MLPVADLRILEPHRAEPGMLLIKNARYDRPPLLMGQMDDVEVYVPLNGAGERAFVLQPVATNMGPYIAISDFEVRVDLESLISPSRDDIPRGAVWMTEDQTLLTIGYSYNTIHMTFEGEILDKHPGLENFAAFGKWQLGMMLDGEFQVLLDTDVMPAPKA